MCPEWGNAQRWDDFSVQFNSIQYNFIFCATNVPVSEWIYCSSLNFWLAFHHSLSITHLLHNNTCVWMGVRSCSDLSLGSAFIDRKNSLKCKTCPWTHFVLYSYCTALQIFWFCHKTCTVLKPWTHIPITKPAHKPLFRQFTNQTDKELLCAPQCSHGFHMICQHCQEAQTMRHFLPFAPVEGRNKSIHLRERGRTRRSYIPVTGD